jgi:hypothetical protein
VTREGEVRYYSQERERGEDELLKAVCAVVNGLRNRKRARRRELLLALIGLRVTITIGERREAPALSHCCPSR